MCIRDSYRGTNFHGWQRQENASSVQENIEISISNLLSNQIKIVGAGRTDTGVHANQMFAHFDHVTKIDSLESLKNKLNNYLSRDIKIINIYSMFSPVACLTFRSVWPLSIVQILR